MNAFAVALLALTLAVGVINPVFADGADQETVTKTFQLTLYSEVPPGELFTVGGTGINILVLCGGASTTTPCRGNGSVYTASIEYRRGTEATFRFIRNEDKPNAREVFGERTETLLRDTVNAAAYTFDATPGPDAPTQLPDTGARGRVADLLFGSAAQVIALLLLGGYMLRRHALTR